MKLVHFHRKPISLVVMLTFTVLLCVWANQAPAAPRSEKDASASMESARSESTGYIEREESAPPAHKGHKIPWLVIGAVVVVGAAALYFLVLKKTKYDLTVTLGTGCTGTPAATAKYNKNTVVNYNYSAQSGYSNLQVMLDGAAVAATGTVTMDKAHSLDVSATYGAAVNITSTPAGAKIYLDNVDSGFTTPHDFQYPAAVTKAVLVRMCGYGDYAETVTANLGQTITVNPTLAAGIHEDFNVPAASCWTPYNSSSWSTINGVYRFNAKAEAWDGSSYNYTFSSNYTLTVKMRMVMGKKTYSTGLFLSDSTSMTAASGYVFQYTAGGSWGIWMAKSFNFVKDTGQFAWMHSWAGNNAIARNLSSWNTLKIVKVGSNYSFYINGTLLYSFSNASYDPRYATLIFYGGNFDTIMEYDYVYLADGATANSIPGLPACPFTSADDIRQSQSGL